MKLTVCAYEKNLEHNQSKKIILCTIYHHQLHADASANYHYNLSSV